MGCHSQVASNQALQVAQADHTLNTFPEMWPWGLRLHCLLQTVLLPPLFTYAFERIRLAQMLFRREWLQRRRKGKAQHHNGTQPAKRASRTPGTTAQATETQGHPSRPPGTAPTRSWLPRTPEHGTIGLSPHHACPLSLRLLHLTGITFMQALPARYLHAPAT